jgi:hypothetical protein
VTGRSLDNSYRLRGDINSDTVYSGNRITHLKPESYPTFNDLNEVLTTFLDGITYGYYTSKAIPKLHSAIFNVSYLACLKLLGYILQTSDPAFSEVSIIFKLGPMTFFPGVEATC